MTKLLGIALLVMVGMSAVGFGGAIRRLARTGTSPASDAGVGLGAMVFLGGLLNLAHLAYAPALWCLVVVGAGCGAWSLWKMRAPDLRERAALLELALAGALVISIAVFAIATQFPPRAVNFHDDLQKYLVHPVRMLALGTVGGNPLSALGSETLGGQAFLHAIVLSALPLPYVNGIDAVLGLVLVALIGAAAGWRRLGPLPGAALAPLVIAFVNPQYVNVSALYIGAALMGTAALLVIDSRRGPPAPLALGLVYAAALAVKSSFLLFVVVHAALSALALVPVLGARRVLGWSGRTAAWTAASLAPWLALHAPAYLRAGASEGSLSPPGAVEHVSSVFSFEPLFYGSTAAHYVALALVGLLGAAAAALCLRSRFDADTRSLAAGLFASLATGVVSFFVLVLVLGPELAGYETSIRYSVPFLLGTVVVPLAALGGLRGQARPGAVRLPIAAALAVAALFVPSWVARSEQAVDAGSILGFSNLARSEQYLAFNREALSDLPSDRVRRVQGLVPSGSPLLSWIATPHHLDQRRNPVYTVEIAALATSWAHLPPDVRYVMWQYAGYGVRSFEQVSARMRGPGAHERLISLRTREFMLRLQRLSENATAIYDDGELALFRLGDG